MTQLVARLALAILLWPLSNVVVMIASYQNHTRNAVWPTPLATSLTVCAALYAFVAIYWMLVWRSMIRWTPARIRGTCVVTGLSLILGALVTGGMATLADMHLSSAIMVSVFVTPSAWVLGTILVWKETPQERLERLRGYGTGEVICPACEYSLTGLRETRCPECGTEFTIDELFSAQPDREQELENA